MKYSGSFGRLFLALTSSNLLNYMRSILIGVAMLFSAVLFSQENDRRLVAYFPFDSYPIVDRSGNGNSIQFQTTSDSILGCGVRGQALKMDGIRTNAFFYGQAFFDNFRTANFSMSFYMKPSNAEGTVVDLFTKKSGCSTDSSFSIRYNPAKKILSVELIENSKKQHVINQRLDYIGGKINFSCWYHVAIVREFNRLSLYINGQLAAPVNTAVSRVAITSEGAPLTIGALDCSGGTGRRFAGFLDEFRLYDAALTPDEVAALYYSPDKIANRDTIIFLGSSVQMNITSACASKTSFQWTPTTGVSNTKIPNPLITPTAGGDYKFTLAIGDSVAFCVAQDTVNIQVIDPKDLNCGQIFLPKAFTPNEDGLNESFFISNPYAVEELLSFEIFDAWGGRMFYTQDKFERWDGTYGNKKVNPGVYLWKALYRCRGNLLSGFGSVTVLK